MFVIFRKRLFQTALFTVLAIVLLLFVAESVTQVKAWGYCHMQPQACPGDRVGLVLGCSKTAASGRPNRFFTGRMDAAAELWHAGKLRCLIVSGDNRTRYYNEPRDMKEALVERGVPAEAIIEDFAGLCTYDSVVRAQTIFGADKLLIISQPSHVQRAVAIARFKGMDAEGYCAPLEPSTVPSDLRWYIRERGARLAMIFDLLTCRRPHLLGDPIPLPDPGR